MGVRSLGNALTTFKYKFGRTGLEAVSPAPVPFVGASGAFAAWGGGGGGGEEGSYGGGGCAVVGSLTLASGTYTFIVGSKGCSFSSPTHGFGGAPVKSHNGGGGGGFSGIFAGDLTPFSFLGDGDSGADPSPNRNTAHAAAIMLAGGGGAAGQEPSAQIGGGGGGGTNGGQGDPGQGGGGTQSGGGGGGPGNAGSGNSGSKLLGGWGPSGAGSGGGGGGYYGGGSGGASTGDGVEAGGGGSGYISPPYGSATLTAGSPGKDPANGTVAATTSPYYPGSAGISGAGRPHSTRDSTAGAFVIGAFSGAAISVTPPGGSPSPVPSSGQAFNTAGKYLLVIS